MKYTFYPPHCRHCGGNALLCKCRKTVKAISVCLAVAAQLSGCAAMIPNTITPEITHESHATQHQPFTQNPTRFGADLADVDLQWRLPHHFVLSLAEGVSLDKHYTTPQYAAESYGEIMGPREQFIGRIGYQFQVRP